MRSMASRVRGVALGALMLCAGVEGSTLGARVVGGLFVEVETDVLVAFRSRDLSTVHCGGLLLEDNVVLTAAHCVDLDEHSNEVLVGGLQATTDSAIVARIENITLHPLYERKANGMHKNDIALVKVQSDEIRFFFPDLPIPVNTGTEVLLSGYGSSKPFSNNFCSNCQFICAFCMADTQACTNPACFPENPLTFFLLRALPVVASSLECQVEGFDAETQFCTTRDSAAPCKGDEGSPVFVDGSLVGLVSFNNNCGVSGPAIYTRLSAYEDFIEDDVIELTLVDLAIAFGAFCAMLVGLRVRNMKHNSKPLSYSKSTAISPATEPEAHKVPPL